VTNSLKGSQRRYALSVLRSLFRHSKKTRRIFHDPTARIRPGRSACKMIVPLQPAHIAGATAAATTPAARLILVLAAVHAARNLGIRELQLHDVDLGNRRLVIAGKARPLDDLTPVFGLGTTTAIRYAEAASKLMQANKK
jgi:hypothetical protein